MSYTRLFETEHYAADFYAAEDSADKVVVTFSELGHRDLDAPGFGTTFLIKNRFDVVSIKSRRDKWYSDFDLDALKRVAAHLDTLPRKHEIRATYGSSMGGYAALTFSRLVGANIAFAISPQFDVTSAEDKRWASFVAPPMRTMTTGDLSQDCRYVLLYDPKDMDAVHADKYHAVLPDHQTTNIEIPYSGHPTGRTLGDAGMLGGLALQILNGRLGDIEHRKLRRSIRSSSRYDYNLAVNLFRSKKPKRAYEAISKALKGNPSHPDYQLNAAKICGALNDMPRQLTHAAAAASLASADPWIIAYLADLLRMQGRRTQAVEQYRRALALRSNPVWEDHIRRLEE